MTKKKESLADKLNRTPSADEIEALKKRYSLTNDGLAELLGYSSGRAILQVLQTEGAAARKMNASARRLFRLVAGEASVADLLAYAKAETEAKAPARKAAARSRYVARKRAAAASQSAG